MSAAPWESASPSHPRLRRAAPSEPPVQAERVVARRAVVAAVAQGVDVRLAGEVVHVEAQRGVGMEVPGGEGVEPRVTVLAHAEAAGLDVADPALRAPADA